MQEEKSILAGICSRCTTKGPKAICFNHLNREVGEGTYQKPNTKRNLMYTYCVCIDTRKRVPKNNFLIIFPFLRLKTSCEVWTFCDLVGPLLFFSQNFLPYKHPKRDSYLGPLVATISFENDCRRRPLGHHGRCQRTIFSYEKLLVLLLQMSPPAISTVFKCSPLKEFCIQ